MNHELKNIWIDALRSGKYKQGRWGLRSFDDSFCCLGVLCDLCVPENWFIGNSRNYYGLKVGNAETIGKLPLSLSEYTELTNEQQNILITLNDEQSKSFSEIADWIEANI